jgi:hypothetical protein
MKIQAWKREVHGLLPIQSRIPRTLPANAALRSLAPSRRHRHKMIFERHEGLIGWFIVDGWFVSYKWSEQDEQWHQFSSDEFDYSKKKSEPAVKFIPIAFSSEHTASSPRHLGESDN